MCDAWPVMRNRPPRLSRNRQAHTQGVDLPSPEVAALALLLTDGIQVNPGDCFPCGWHAPNPIFGALVRYVTATPDLLTLAHALVDQWRRNFDTP